MIITDYILLAIILTFVRQNLIQYILCTSWYFRNYSRL